MRILSQFCVIAPAAAQFGFSLGPALESWAAGLQSLGEPSDTPALAPVPAPAPTPTAQTTRARQSSVPTLLPPLHTSSTSSLFTRKPITSSTSFTTSSISETEPTATSSTHSTSTSSASTTSAASESSGGLSKDAKIGIGVGIAVFVICGLLAGALYSFVRDRHASEAFANWRERRRHKHTRLGSSATNSPFYSAEKQMESNQAEYGNGTILTGPTVYPPSQSSQNLVPDLPAPPVAYQQARVVHIKRKAVPGQAVPQSQPQTQRPRFSWMD